jgi:hypothetical protein
MKALLITMIALLVMVVGVDARAQNNKPAQWHFYTIMTTKAERVGVDYSYPSDLSQDIAVALPISMTRAGWNCVRQEVRGYGGFACRNGLVEFDNFVSCTDGSNRNKMILQFAGGSVEFSAECDR